MKVGAAPSQDWGSLGIKVGIKWQNQCSTASTMSEIHTACN